jgi:hypothetical protein
MSVEFDYEDLGMMVDRAVFEEIKACGDLVNFMGKQFRGEWEFFPHCTEKFVESIKYILNERKIVCVTISNSMLGLGNALEHGFILVKIDGHTIYFY